MSATPSTITGTLDVLRQPVTIAAPDTTASDIFGILRGGAALASEVMDTNRRFDREVQQMEREARAEAAQMAQEAIDKDNRDRAITRESQREREQLANEESATLRGLFLDGANRELIRLTEQVNSNDPSILPVVGDSPEDRQAWADSFAANVASSLSIAPDAVAGERRDIANRVLALFSNKSVNIRRDGEEQRHFFVGQQLRSPNTTPEQFRDTVQAINANAKFTPPEKILSEVVAPALRDIAQSGDVEKVRAIVSTLGYDKDETTSAFATDLVQSAQVAQTRLRNQQQSEIRGQLMDDLFFSTGDDGTPDVGKLTALRQRLTSEVKNGTVDPDFAVRLQGSIDNSIAQVSAQRERERQELEKQDLKDRLIAATGAAMLAGDTTLAPDPAVAGMSRSQAMEMGWSAIMQSTILNEANKARANGITDPRAIEATAAAAALPSLVSKAARIHYVPDDWRTTVREALSQAETASNSNEPARATPTMQRAWAIYSQAAARSPSYASTLIGDEKMAATMELVASQMEVPGTTLDQAFAFATRRRTVGFTRIPDNDKEVVKVADGDRVTQSHLARIANTFTRRGLPPEQALPLAVKHFDNNSVEVNGRKVYMGARENLYSRVNSSVSSDLPGAMEFLLDDIAAKSGQSWTDVDGKPATGKDLSFMLDVESGVYMVYDTRTGSTVPLQPKTAEDVSQIAFTTDQLAAALPNPYQRREQARRAEQERNRNSNLNTGMMPFAR